VLKKITGKPAEEHYAVIDGHGQVYDRVPEFTVMSRRPGVGTGYYDKFGAELRVHDNVIVNGKEVPPPRFYDAKTELIDSKLYVSLKKARKRKALLNKADNTSVRLRVKEVIALKRLSQSKRSV
jgi:hypothetical protein